MPSRKNPSGRAGVRRRKRNGTASIPRGPSVGTVAVLRRALDSGLIGRAAADAGAQFGTVPGSLLDWGSLQVIWGRYRLLKVVDHFLVSGEFDGTPAYPTFLVYHDYMSAGAPASITEAMMKRGVRELSFNATTQHRTFEYVPMVWTSSAFATQLPAPSVHYQTATAFAPVFSSVAAWMLNYNTTVGSCPVRLVQEMVLEFSLPI